MLELRGQHDAPLLVMSARAAVSLAPATLERLQAGGTRLLRVAVPTIEALGGGSVRCMIAEVPLPSRIPA